MNTFKRFLSNKGQSFYLTLEISFAILLLAALILLIFV